MRRLGIQALRRSLSALLVSMLIGACGVFKASQPDCIRDSGQPCTASYCGLVRTACAKNARLCGKPQGECDVEVCAQDVAGTLSTVESPGKAARQFYECVTRQASCENVAGCFTALTKNERCEKEADQLKSDLTRILPTRIAPEGGGIAGVVVLPGDDLQCLQCAFEPGGCAEAFPDCFTAAPRSAGATDTCLDYRVCLRTCEQTSGDDALRYTTCVAQYCAPEQSQGSQTFSDYRKCMFQRCSACVTQRR